MCNGGWFMKLVVYKGFDENFLSKVKEEPLVDNIIASKNDVLKFDKKTRKKLDMALLSMDESDEMWVSYAEYTLIKNRVDDAIEEDGLKLVSDIVILTLKTEAESIMNNIVKISGIPITNEKSNSSILFTTAKKFKGLESRVIIVVDIDEASFNDEREKRNFYVACSRATQYLLLVVEGDDKKIKSIADCISGPNFAPKGKIAMKTQAMLLNLD